MEIASRKQQTARIADLERSRESQTGELVSLREQVGRIAELERQAARVNALLQNLESQWASTSASDTARRAEPPVK